ncbi:hypothetical protein [Serratia sp. DD3]|uniref:hypothetical protein n=1 Tax=Serratia sp. DD3 TaxID=1410619 RepID=UPI0003C51155|nr:hypothetical protein [Serratia sp. DD3]KEY58492.1 hypothetical protein SRDD_27390 [Serratia sp. DD3]
MKVKEYLALHGNINRIVEMDAGGMGANAIAGTFQDNDILINADDVRFVLARFPVLSSKALPKAVARKAIKATKIFNGETA